MTDIAEGPVRSNTGILGDLARRRAELQNEQLLTIDVPRWEKPRLKIVFRPIDHSALKRAAQTQERASKDRDSRKSARVELDTNADLLVNACVEIVAILDDGSETGVGPDGLHTRFDQDLAIALGMPPEAGARAVCQNLFITNGDLLAVARQVGEWSGYREDSIESDMAGES